MTSTRIRAAFFLALIGLPGSTVAQINPAHAPSEAATPGAATTETRTPFLLTPDSHVRAMDPEARHLLEAAIACSPTVNRIVGELEASDVIARVETRPFQKVTLGELQIIGATGDTRYVRISLRTPGETEALMSVLGHGLRYAAEVAVAPEVRDRATERAYFLRIGWARSDQGFYETEAALETGRQVAREVAGCKF